AGLEMPAVALDHDRAQNIRAGERLHRRQQTLDENIVIGVVDLGPVENDARHSARIDVPQNRAGGIRSCHCALLSAAARSFRFAQSRSSPSMPALRRARLTRSITIGPTSAGFSTGSAVGPRCQPSITAKKPPPTSNTRPVTWPDCRLASQTTIGGTHRASHR